MILRSDAVPWYKIRTQKFDILSLLHDKFVLLLWALSAGHVV